MTSGFDLEADLVQVGVANQTTMLAYESLDGEESAVRALAVGRRAAVWRHEGGVVELSHLS